MQDLPKVTSIPLKTVDKGTSSTDYINKLISFMETYLPEFVIDGTQSERIICSKLWKFLTRRKKFNSENVEYPFEFQSESPQQKKRQKGHPSYVDAAVWLNTEDPEMQIIYCLEAKKLPTGKDKKREKEYVAGDGGGINRFRTERHGLDDDGNLVENNGIVAYITDKDYEYWHTQINQWIIDAGWGDSEKLDKIYFDRIGKLCSQHTRQHGSTVKLTHFWLQVS